MIATEAKKNPTSKDMATFESAFAIKLCTISMVIKDNTEKSKMKNRRGEKREYKLLIKYKKLNNTTYTSI